jgi:flagellar protein FliS
MNAYAAAAPTSAYKESSVLTAPPERLVLMLYDGINRFLHQATVAQRDGNVELWNIKLQRAEAIIDELIATLDHSVGEIADKLNAIYLYSRRSLSEARIEKSPEKIEHVQGLIKEIRDAWAQICGGAEGGAEV